MRKVLKSFLAGAVLAAVLFFLFASRTESPVLAELPAQSIAPADPATLLPETDRSLMTATLTSGDDEVGQVVGVANDILPVPIPIAKPPMKLVYMLEGTAFVPVPTDGAAHVHAEIEREPIDIGWASTTEFELHDFYSKAPVLPDFGYPSIHCRSTMCVVQAVSDDQVSQTLWDRDMRHLFDQPWGSQFGGAPYYIGTYPTQSDQIAILWYLKKEESQSESAAVTPFGI